MFELIKNIFTGLLTGIVNESNYSNCVSLSNRKCKIQPTLLNLHPNRYSLKFDFYPFSIKLDRCA